MKLVSQKLRSYDIAYGCFAFCGGAAFFIGALSFVPMGPGVAGGIGILMGGPITVAAIVAMGAGLVYTVILYQHWPFIVLSILTVLFAAEIVTEFGPVELYNLAPIIYGVITSTFGLAWAMKFRREHA